jgi:hypothetical protein
MAVGADDLDGDAILAVGIPGGNVLGILLGLGNNRLHFALAIHVGTAPAMTMEAVTRGHRHIKWGGGAQQVPGSHGTRIRQHRDNGVAVGA